MSDAKHHELIIVRRHEEEEHEAHSSAWKVAHADFMTAMMAFFLIMWLINVTDEQVKRSIANYFNPVKLSSSVTNRKGLNDEGMVTPTGPKLKGDQTSAGPVVSEEASEHAAAPEHAGSVAIAAAGTAQGGENSEESVASMGLGGAAEQSAAESSAHAESASEHGEPAASPDDPASQQAAATVDGEAAERAAFSDPYAVLARIAAEAPKPNLQSPDVPVGADGASGVDGGDVARDPFDPIYWQMAPAHDAVTETPRPADTATTVPSGARPDAAAASEGDAAAATSEMVVPSGAETEAVPADPVSIHSPAEPAGGVSASGETAARPEQAVTMQVSTPASSESEAAEVKDELTAALSTSLGSSDLPNIEVKATPEGILISLTDDIRFSMFDIGSAIPKPNVVVAMDKVAGVLATHPGSIVVRGHTDGRPFHSDTYDNWRLSTARAHMAYYMLTRGRLPESRIVRIEGFADRELKNPRDPLAAENRRIEVLLQETSA